MASSRKRKAPKGRTVYEGPVGLCPCCNKPTEVRRASTLGEPQPPGWVVPDDVLGVIYREVSARVKTDAACLCNATDSKLVAGHFQLGFLESVG